MAKRVAERFSNQRVVLDEDEFFECTFNRCEIVYQGGDKAYLVGCRFEDQCSFRFEGAALRTLAFLRGMYHHMGQPGLRLVENTFNEIRRPDAPADEEPFAAPAWGEGAREDDRAFTADGAVVQRD